MTPLNGIPSGVLASNAYSINDSGQIAVFGRDAQAPAGYALLWTPSALRGSSGSAVNLALDSPLSIDDAGPGGINASGQVTGEARLIPQQGRAFLWKPSAPNGSSGTMYDLGSLDPVNNGSGGIAINSVGQIAGVTTAATGEQPMMWTPDSPNGTTGTMVQLAGVAGKTGSAQAINDAGLIVGRFGSHAHQYVPALWLSPTEMIDLNTALDASGSGWVLQEAYGINDSGQIVGWGFYDPDGPGGADEVQRGFLLTPAVPEPASIALIVGVLVLARRRARLIPN
jgi:probable HAF family extracellular repeat protein